MIDLKHITLLGIDCLHPHRLLRAMKYSCSFVQFQEVVILTDKTKLLQLPAGTLPPPTLRVVDHIESNTKRSFVGLPITLPVDYEMAVLRETPKHFQTPHVLYMEWDSAIMNPWAWDPQWLQYDFIGAPWPHHAEPGWPACDASNNVGNGGFSLKSKRFCELVASAALADPREKPEMYSSDRWMCRSLRPWLESKGMKFAPEAVAARFSCENVGYSGQFGYHGKWTAALNNWGTVLGDVR